MRDGIELLKQKCISNSLSKTTQSTLTSYPKYSLNSYNNSKHRSIGMTPKEARKPENYGKAYFHLYGDLGSAGAKPAFAVGNRVRISKYKRKTFDKGYTPNWTEEVFTIDKIQMTHPITYKIRTKMVKRFKALFTEKSCKRQTKRSIE